jgi:hypothetical protein
MEVGKGSREKNVTRFNDDQNKARGSSSLRFVFFFSLAEIAALTRARSGSHIRATVSNSMGVVSLRSHVGPAVWYMLYKTFQIQEA